MERNYVTVTLCEKNSPYSITKRRVPELIPVLGSQPAGDAAITFRQACSYLRKP